MAGRIRRSTVAAAVAVACVAGAVTSRPVRAETTPTPAVVTVTGEALATADSSVTYDIEVNGLTLKPWYVLGKPVLGNVWGKVTHWSYKTKSEAECLFGLAWDIHIIDTPTRTVSFKCMWVFRMWTVVGYGEINPTLPVAHMGMLAAGDGPQPDGYLFQSWDDGGWDPRPEAKAAVHVDFL